LQVSVLLRGIGLAIARLDPRGELGLPDIEPADPPVTRRSSAPCVSIKAEPSRAMASAGALCRAAKAVRRVTASPSGMARRAMAVARFTMAGSPRQSAR
jgi:hypothetical protein